MTFEGPALRMSECMAITLEATYSKKLGLPNFSSHCFVVSLSTELTELSQVERETAKLYAILQQSVDRELTEVGYLPDASSYGMNGSGTNGNHPPVNGSSGASRRNGDSSSPERRPTRVSSRARRSNSNSRPDAADQQPWACSDKQRGLILHLVKEHKLDKNEVEAMAQQLFGIGVKECDKMQASQLIEELFEKVGKARPKQSRSRWQRRQQQQSAEAQA